MFQREIKDFNFYNQNLLFCCIVSLPFGQTGHSFDRDVNPSWNAAWWGKLGATGFSGLPPWVVELLVRWEALGVNRSRHGNTDMVRSSGGRGRCYACCIYKDKGQRRKRAEGVLVSKQGQEKISGNIHRAPWCGWKRFVHVSSFPTQEPGENIGFYQRIIMMIYGWEHGQIIIKILSNTSIQQLGHWFWFKIYFPFDLDHGPLVCLERQQSW